MNKLTATLNDNIKLIKELFNNDSTLISKACTNKNSTMKVCIFYIDGMCDTETINENIILPIVNYEGEVNGDNQNSYEQNMLQLLMEKILYCGEINKVADLEDALTHMLYGDTILLLDGYEEMLIINTKGWKTRDVIEPLSETIVRGPREGFTESIIINLSLIRRKIRSTDLKFKFKQIGVRTKTRVGICYVEGIVNEQILQEVEKRLDEINIDGILDSGYLEDFIKDEPFTPFNTIGSTERPDTVAGKLLEGRIAIICDGSPVVLTVPFIFTEYFQVNEDYFNTFIFSSINRLLRAIGFVLATSVPAVYVALTTFHQEMIPTPLLVGIYEARQGVPFPTVIEAFIMLLIFEVLREAGLRLPKFIGQAVSIVGALVLGDAAVNASIISAPMVIVTATTGIASFLIPQMLGALIVVRVIFLILASFLGLYGYIFGIIGLFIHLMSMKSFGVPYMLNTSINKLKDLQDMAVRAPWWYMNYRVDIIAKDPKRKIKESFIRRRDRA